VDRTIDAPVGDEDDKATEPEVSAPPKKKAKVGRPKKDPALRSSAAWCDDSVRLLLKLRYKDLAARFNSKSNAEKKVAWGFLTAELSQRMDRIYTSKQLQDKVPDVLVWTAKLTRA